MTRTWRVVGVVAGTLGVGGVLALGFGLVGGAARPDQEESVTGINIEDAQKALTDSLMLKAGIAGTAITECDGTPCLKVYVVEQTKRIMDQIPKTFEGYEVTVQETGEIEARE